jgi:hypothetical protein
MPFNGHPDVSNSSCMPIIREEFYKLMVDMGFISEGNVIHYMPFTVNLISRAHFY